MFNNSPKNKRNQGSSLLAVLGIVAALLTITGTLFRTVGSRCLSTYHAGAWSEALNTAETGAQTGLIALNSIATTGTDPAQWPGWLSGTAARLPSPFVAKLTGTLPGNDTRPARYYSILVAPIPSDGSTIGYRFRSTGVVQLPGPSGVAQHESAVLSSGSIKNIRNMLRRLNFRGEDNSGGAIGLPQTSRTVEVCAVRNTGNSPFARALTTIKGIKFDGGTRFDSYDSTDPSKSNGCQGHSGGTYPGMGDPRTQHHGNIASYSAMDARDVNGNLLNVWGSQSTPTVDGDGFSNGGEWPPISPWSGAPTNWWEHATVTGTVNTRWTPPPLQSVEAPAWGDQFTSAKLLSPTDASKLQPIYGGSQSSPVRLSYSEITIQRDDVQHLSNPPGTDSSYMEIYVHGDLQIIAAGQLVLDPGVHVTFYVDGNVNINGAGVANGTGVPANLIVYGITPFIPDTRTFNVNAGGQLVAAIYAPDYNFVLDGGTNLCGSGVFRSANIQGSGSVHYDESLANIAGSGPAPTEFKVASWTEDLYSQKDNPNP